MNQLNFAYIEYSKQLKDEFPESEWWWAVSKTEDMKSILPRNDRYRESLLKNNNLYPALTTDLLLERLPKKIKGHTDLCICYDDNYSKGGWWVGYEGKTLADELAASDKSLPNALAKMLIWLKETK